jgi:hypothetical protein
VRDRHADDGPGQRQLAAPPVDGVEQRRDDDPAAHHDADDGTPVTDTIDAEHHHQPDAQRDAAAQRQAPPLLAELTAFPGGVDTHGHEHTESHDQERK